MKRLVLFVEGEGDSEAVPALVGALVRRLPDELQSHLLPGGDPFLVGDVTQLLAKRKGKSGSPEDRFGHYLLAAAKQKPFGGVLVLLDGDKDKLKGKPFCAVTAARLLGERAQQHGAGRLFSVAVCFAVKEFESFLIPVSPQFLPGITEAELPANPESSGKKWLKDRMKKVGGYNPVPDQARLTRQVTDWSPARAMKSFRRLERVVRQLAEAFAADRHIVSPPPMDPVTVEG